MKAAILVPVSLTSLIQGNPYHLALAHLVLANPTLGTFYMHEADTGSFIILDNSVHELGKPLPLEDLEDALEKTFASVLVIPDILYDAKANLRGIENFREAKSRLQKTFPELLVMGVPHGKDKKELVDNFTQLSKIDFLDMIGLPKTFPRLKVSRGEIAKLTQKKVHFLGIWENPIKEVLEGKESQNVTGIDSSFPIRLALAGRTILEYFPTPKQLNFSLNRNTVANLSWIKAQLDAYKWLVESKASSEEELKQEYKNGRF